MSDNTSLLRAIEAPTDQPQATYRALESIVEKTVGVRLFTLMEIDHERAVAWRNYSNMPDAYPISGEKPVQKNRWSEIVEDRREIFVANTIDEIAEVFPDYPLIQSLGCESCMNIPIVIAGQLRGTLNCLHVAGYYKADRVARAEHLKLPGTLAFMMAAACRSNGENHV
jgi:transcriptional regulator with GAF, ATPase, and Fis domain